MKKAWLTIQLFIYLLLAVTKVSAQKDTSQLISIQADSINIQQLAEQIESQTKLRLFFDTAYFRNQRFTIHQNNLPVRGILEKAFASTDYSFSFFEPNYVFITKDRPIVTSLAKDKISNAGGAGNNKDNIDNSDGKEINAVKSTQENKLYVIGDKTTASSQRNAIVDGYAIDGKTGEPIPGAFLHVDNTNVSALTDQYGYFSLSLPAGRHTVTIQSLGMKDTRRLIQIVGDGKLNIELQSQVLTIRNVTISSQKLSNIKSTQMGVQKIDIKTVKQVPVAFGEADIIRVVTTLPGVKTVGEASTGLNVRGGSTDQNLILFNDATIYNPSHFFGLFSALNSEIIKDVELYKSSMPARYGGRLSSVLNINGKEGNKKALSGSAGIGLLTSRINLEGPIVKDKTSFVVGGRSTYAKWLLKKLPEEYRNSNADFYDANISITHEASRKNTFYLTGYISQDHFNLNSDTAYGYQNMNASLKWKHVFNNKLNSVFTTGIDKYKYTISSEKLALNAYKMGFDIQQLYLRTHFNYFLDNNHSLDFGLNSTLYKLNPGYFVPNGKESLVIADQMEAEHALESAVYVNDRYKVTGDLTFEGGVRYSYFNYLGPKTINTYAAGLPITENNQTGSVYYAKGSVIKNYGAPEIRLSARYAINDSFSIKASFNTQRQYIHMLSNTAAMAPTDIWKLSDPSIKPQSGSQVALGLYRNFKNNTIETSLEVYYKKISNYLDYKSGANLVLNHHIETDVIGTRGKAYGVELLVKKLTGKLNGWVSYTWSRILLKQSDPNVGEVINGGSYYPANYDKPHDLTFIGNYRINHRFSISLNATYSTGRPITLPIGRFIYAGSVRTLYSDRNAYRIPDYYRADFSMNLEGNHKIHQKFHNSWTFGIYNITGRKNPYSVYYVSEGGAINGYKLSIFGSAIPYINYNIRF